MTETQAPAISISNLTKFYGSPKGRRMKALENVTLTVGRGEFVSIIGPSGCGKTTMLKMVGGILGWDEGSIEVLGKPVTGPGPERATVFQSFALLPWMTVIDNVSFGLKVRGMAKPERYAVARKLLASVGLADFETSYPRQLSGGMQQRVGLARALAVSPQLLLMDEPFSAIDAQTRLILQTDLLDIWSKTDLSVLFITHAMDEAVFLSDKVVIMGARPGHVTDIIDVDLPRPRTEETRRDPRFVELTGFVWDRLRGMIQQDERAA
ncbi:MAG: ABC transporter ATP-binding protein [Devosia sp.]|uniref:ABC transporter ATP-binding protein n=1 Tax=Devosia sp. 66-22 TaxID=1895753 RepID=UPI000926CB89|nr:ABC transporter ATP-binding protein [Devosia sp. 66-22]MBN9347444.1 ABC transporter ATP-binding protein [Devosia sp.]OJX47462.1 MAG: ABC transporter ATP-binding protein [Devosia sp. 66-22]